MTNAHNKRAGHFGRTLKLFLVNGSSSGVITAELGNWSGKVICAPRTYLPDLLERDESSRAGVYLLSGEDPDNNSRLRVYIGQSQNPNTRLGQHDSDPKKDYVTQICLIISHGENLTSAHTRYLEARILELAREASRAVLDVHQYPNSSVILPEADAATMEGFLSEIQLILPLFGLNILDRVSVNRDSKETVKRTEPMYKFTEAGTNATAIEIDGKFVVLANSTVRVKETTTITETTRRKRQELIDNKDLVVLDDNKFYKLMLDIPFPSPSCAASIVYGGDIGGPQNWKRISDGKTYKRCREMQIAKAQEKAKK